MTQNIAILGSTGSVGTSTLDICREHPQRFRVVALAAGENCEKLAAQIEEFSPLLVSVKSEADAQKLKNLIKRPVEIAFGEAGAIAVATHPEAPTIVSAIVGAAGLTATFKAIEAGKKIALANKESFIIAGEILSKLAQKTGSRIIPVDSEHSAIFQCLNGEDKEGVKRLILTASGGPFFATPAHEFASITKAQALKHPNWKMGEKITIDSATLMNKGLEVIEAHHLFDMPIDRIDVIVHPQSIVHSLVEFIDGSTLAQLGEPDMRVPIAYALSYPKRVPLSGQRLELPTHETLTFFAPDTNKFKCLAIAFQAARQGGSVIPVLNAANEIAVEAFLCQNIHFTQIPEVIEKTLSAHSTYKLVDLADVLRADAWARAHAAKTVARIAEKR